ncbi:MAG: dihydroorotate dehydrogenase [Chloroflexota bacterium]|nr:dihydroorotate dehydrogenase [Chloroflexota bacterium]
MPDLSVNIAPGHETGLVLRNPVIISCGTFGQDGYGSHMPSGVDYQRLGGVVAKTTTIQPRLGNAKPRITHARSWTMNSIGLQNPGIGVVLQEQAPRWVDWQVPVILSIAGERIDEYQELATAIEGTPGIAAIEINVSCPNVEGGLDFGQSSDFTGEAVRAVVTSTNLPVITKLSPNVTDIVAIAKAAAEAGSHALSLTNTLVGMAIDHDKARSVLGTITGGISGPALKPVALAMVYKTYRAVNIPIIGIGGIETTGDALDYLYAGACAIQIGTANFASPRTPQNVLAGIERYMTLRKVTSMAGLVGLAHGDTLFTPS